MTGKAKQITGLFYFIQESPVKLKSYPTIFSKITTFHLWHHRLGHLSNGKLLILQLQS